MIPVAQTKRGGSGVPPEERGDCLAACLASLLEVGIGDVPVPHSDDRHWWDVMQEALHAHGWYCVVADRNIYPSGYWFALVPSKNLIRPDGVPESHVVVMFNGELAHDPALGASYQPGTPIEYIEIRSAYVLVPLVTRSAALRGDET